MHVLGKFKIGMMQPLGPGGPHPLSAMGFWAVAARQRGQYVAEPMCRVSTLLARGFNLLWASIVEAIHTKGYTHGAMLHGDVCPAPGWLDVLFAEICRLDADLVSVIIPVKDAKGLTSTAIGDPADIWRPVRRLTMREIYERLPETFSIDDCIRAGLAEPGHQLWTNTGCWIANVRRPWARAIDADGCLKVCFTIRDRIRWDGSKATVEVHPEDWGFARVLANEGGRVYATRKIRAVHAGEQFFPNDHAWGEWETDEEA